MERHTATWAGLTIVCNPDIPPDVVQFVGAQQIDSFTIEGGRAVDHHITPISPEESERVRLSPTE